MNDKNVRLTGLRGWVQKNDERRERENALPKALCRVCGGWAKAGEGSRDPEPPRGLVPLPANPSRVVLVTPPHAPEDADGWRRACDICTGATSGEIVGAVVGRTVDSRDAQKVIGRMHRFDENDFLVQEFPTAQTTGRGTGRPWAHLSTEDRERVQQVLREVIRDRQSGPCVQGACGLCGRRNSVRWFEGYAFLTWPDGSPAPVCTECQEVVDRRPATQSIEQLRVIAVESATGFSQMLYEAPSDFRVYAESKDSDGNGYAEPWAYSPGVVAFREDMWEQRPYLAPADRRAEFEALLRERIAEQARQVQAQQEAAHAAAW